MRKAQWVVDSRLKVLMALALLAIPASAWATPISIFSVAGSGFVSLDKGVTRQAIDITESGLPGGGSIVGGSGVLEIRVGPGTDSIIAAATSSGVAFAEPGRLGAASHGVAQTGAGGLGDLGGWAFADFSATSLEYILIPGTPGSEVTFTPSWQLFGTTSSEVPGLGPYTTRAFGGYDTGLFGFSFEFWTVDGATEAFNGNYNIYFMNFPNAAFSSISPHYDGVGQSYTVTARAGDFLAIRTGIGTRADDRAFDGYVFQESHVAFDSTVHLYVDSVTPGLTFVGNGHDYSSPTATDPDPTDPIDPAVVPEPASILLVASGLAATFVRLRRRRSRSAS